MPRDWALGQVLYVCAVLPRTDGPVAEVVEIQNGVISGLCN